MLHHPLVPMTKVHKTLPHHFARYFEEHVTHKDGSCKPRCWDPQDHESLNESKEPPPIEGAPTGTSAIPLPWAAGVRTTSCIAWGQNPKGSCLENATCTQNTQATHREATIRSQKPQLSPIEATIYSQKPQPAHTQVITCSQKPQLSHSEATIRSPKPQRAHIEARSCHRKSHLTHTEATTHSRNLQFAHTEGTDVCHVVMKCGVGIKQTKENRVPNEGMAQSAICCSSRYNYTNNQNLHKEQSPMSRAASLHQNEAGRNELLGRTDPCMLTRTRQTLRPKSLGASQTGVSLESVDLWESDSDNEAEKSECGNVSNDERGFDRINGVLINPRKTFDFSELHRSHDVKVSWGESVRPPQAETLCGSSVPTPVTAVGSQEAGQVHSVIRRLRYLQQKYAELEAEKLSGKKLDTGNGNRPKTRREEQRECGERGESGERKEQVKPVAEKQGDVKAKEQRGSVANQQKAEADRYKNAKFRKHSCSKERREQRRVPLTGLTKSSAVIIETKKHSKGILVPPREILQVTPCGSPHGVTCERRWEVASKRWGKAVSELHVTTLTEGRGLCVSCDTGLGEGHDLCALCNTGLMMVQGLCTSCGSNFMNGRGLCTSCDTTLMNGRGLCTSCDTGLTNGRGLSTSCNTGLTNGRGLCTSCDTGLTNGRGLCTSCDTGLTNGRGLCTSCDTGLMKGRGLSTSCDTGLTEGRGGPQGNMQEVETTNSTCPQTRRSRKRVKFNTIVSVRDGEQVRMGALRQSVTDHNMSVRYTLAGTRHT